MLFKRASAVRGNGTDVSEWVVHAGQETYIY